MPKFMDHVEAEWQFDVDDLRPIEKWLRDLPGSIQVAVTTAEPIEHLDTYFDTPDWRIYRAGYVLRLRRLPFRAELTLKSLGDHVDGYVHRREVTQQVNDAEIDTIDGLCGPVADRVLAIRGHQPTKPLFTAITMRQRYPIWREGRQLGELALDNTTYIGETFEDQSQASRVEVETSVEQTQRVKPFVATMASACGLRPANASKFSTGISILGLRPPAPADVGPVAFDRLSTVADLAFAVLRRNFVELLGHEPGTRLGDDVEELHDMRVAARRLRAALSLFSSYYPPEFDEARNELRWIASALGEVRDLDVQLSEIQGWKAQLDPRDSAALDALIAELNRRRDAARDRMLEALNSERYGQFVSDFSARLIAGPETSDSSPALVAAPDLVLRRFRKFQRKADRLRRDSADAEFHAVRVEGKRLRYALEFVRPLYGKMVGQFIEHLVAVQDVLGRHQDSIIAIDHLRDLSSDAEAHLDSATVFAIGRVAERYAMAAVESRGEFPKVYKQLSGKRRERLEREMRRRSQHLPKSLVETSESPAPVAQAAAATTEEESPVVEIDMLDDRNAS